MADKNNQDLYNGNGADDAIADSSAVAVRHLIAKGKKLGYITMYMDLIHQMWL